MGAISRRLTLVARRRFLVGLCVVCLLGAFSVAGCGKSEPPKQVPLPADLVQFKADVEKTRAQTDVTLTKLDALVATTSGDLTAPYKAFTEAVAKLDADRTALLKRGDDMKAKGAAYFQQWESKLAAISTPEVKEVAEKRKADLTAKYTALLETMGTTREMSDALFGQLKDVEKILGNDLNADGLKGIAPMVEKVKEARKPVKENVDAIMGRLEEISAVYSRP
jgi:hypothetical protein